MHTTLELSRRVEDSDIHGVQLFHEIFNEFPSITIEGNGDDSELRYQNTEDASDEMRADLLTQIDKFSENVLQVINKIFGSQKQQTTVEYRTFVTTENVYARKAIIINEYHLVLVCTVMPLSGGQKIKLFASDQEKYKEQIRQLAQYVCTLKTQPKAKQDTLKIICRDDCFYLRSIDLGAQQHQFSLDNYNDDFGPVCNKIIEKLKRKNSSGLVLLHGIMGSGKTSYLKYLLHEVSNRQIIYVPPDLVELISNPSFVSFMLAEAKNSILLIEDAENILKPREVGGSQAVSNILNLSDGLLSQSLQLSIVCTFNCDISEIDQALRRPMRLIGEYEFRSLNRAKTKTLMQKLYGSDVQYDNDEMTLAEIYGFSDMPEHGQQKQKIKMGFA